MAKVIKKWEFSPRNSRVTGYPWKKWTTLDDEGKGQIIVIQKGTDFTSSVRSITTQLTQKASKLKLAVEYDAVRVVDGEYEQVQASDPKATTVIFRFHDPERFNPEEA